MPFLYIILLLEKLVQNLCGVSLGSGSERFEKSDQDPNKIRSDRYHCLILIRRVRETRAYTVNIETILNIKFSKR
jgi:hypothetical protein